MAERISVDPIDKNALILHDFGVLTPLDAVRNRFPAGTLKPFLESGALVKLKLAHIFWKLGHFLAPGLAAFSELTPLDAVRNRFSTRTLKPFPESGALVKLKLAHIFWKPGHFLAPGLAAFCELTPLDGVRLFSHLSSVGRAAD